MRWIIDGEAFGYLGGADNSSDVSHGFKHQLRSDGGDTAEVNVEAVNGASVRMSELDARSAVRKYLDGGQTPPRRVVMDAKATSDRGPRSVRDGRR